jgi:hypothetical protein
MAFVYTELNDEQHAWLQGLGLQNPWGGGAARFPHWAAVDAERGAVVTGLGGGWRGASQYWTLIIGRDVLLLVGKTDPYANPPEDRRLVVWIDCGVPEDSPLWKVADLHELLKKGLFMYITEGKTYGPGILWFRGPLGDLIEEA